jgi:hypothetical protein
MGLEPFTAMVSIHRERPNQGANAIEREVNQGSVPNGTQRLGEQLRQRVKPGSCTRSEHHADEVSARNAGGWCGNGFHP